IYYRNDVRKSGVDGRALVATAKRLLAAAGEGSSSLSLTLVADRAIRAINFEHRGKDAATDVLSFPMTTLREPATAARIGPKPERMLGDVVISIDTARRQAADYDATLQNELYRLLIHGVAHVLGHDHMEAAERRAMESEERRLADAIALPWPYEAVR
ncbi:MAG: rRNA maturation RNase YbeY, partial [Candidatus Tumulicola sp.]